MRKRPAPAPDAASPELLHFRVGDWIGDGPPADWRPEWTALDRRSVWAVRRWSDARFAYKAEHGEWPHA